MEWTQDPRLEPIAEKVRQGIRISDQDALTLYATPDLPAVGRMARFMKEQRWGKQVTYVINRHINYSNLCTLSCMFCAFAKKRGDTDGYEYSLQQIFDKAAEAVGVGASEVHIVGGLHPDHPYQFYRDMLSGLRERFPRLQLKCFTAVELDYLAQLAGMTVPQVIEDLKAHGLHSVPGGGAEILTDRVWKKLYRDKMGPAKWIAIHRMIHQAGVRSNATMLYGHIETLEECVEHMRKLRDLQDETGGFLTFIPLRFHPDNTPLEKLAMASAITSLRHIAIGRIYLDNFPHIKTYWTMQGLDVSQLALYHGADDFDGTVIEEKITHMAGGTAPQGLTPSRICELIRETGNTPVLRDSVYNPLPEPAAAHV